MIIFVYVFSGIALLMCLVTLVFTIIDMVKNKGKEYEPSTKKQRKLKKSKNNN